MKLESLKNGLFEKNVISKSAMLMLNGGKLFATGQGSNSDSIEYHCSGPNGNLYDRTWTDSSGQSLIESSERMFEGTDSSWYE